MVAVVLLEGRKVCDIESAVDVAEPLGSLQNPDAADGDGSKVANMEDPLLPLAQLLVT